MSDFKELLVPALQSELGQQTLEKAEEFLGNVLAEPSQAIGGFLADKINYRRSRNLARTVAKAKKILHDLNLTERDVPLKIINPALEGASVEEEPDMQRLWANLFAMAVIL